jgi:hypothetical protein
MPKMWEEMEFTWPNLYLTLFSAVAFFGLETFCVWATVTAHYPGHQVAMVLQTAGIATALGFLLGSAYHQWCALRSRGRIEQSGN